MFQPSQRQNLRFVDSLSKKYYKSQKTKRKRQLYSKSFKGYSWEFPTTVRAAVCKLIFILHFVQVTRATSKTGIFNIFLVCIFSSRNHKSETKNFFRQFFWDALGDVYKRLPHRCAVYVRFFREEIGCALKLDRVEKEVILRIIVKTSRRHKKISPRRLCFLSGFWAYCFM